MIFPIIRIWVITMDYPTRKPNRLTEYSYKTPNAYFITICTANKLHLFWHPVGASIARPEDVQLSRYGVIVDEAIRSIPKYYPAVSLDHYVIMPNHIHLLLQIKSDCDGRPMVAPTISTVVQQMKGAVSKRVGFPVWQKGFHDHVIRSETDYQEIWEYIENNPARWTEDQLYSEPAHHNPQIPLK